MEEEPEVIELGDTLDLHQFRPADVGELVPDFLEDARAKGFQVVRIIHGKGTGALRRSVHALLDRSPHVASYALAETWGATVVTLAPPEPPEPSDR